MFLLIDQHFRPYLVQAQKGTVRMGSEQHINSGKLLVKRPVARQGEQENEKENKYNLVSHSPKVIKWGLKTNVPDKNVIYYPEETLIVSKLWQYNCNAIIFPLSLIFPKFAMPFSNPKNHTGDSTPAHEIGHTSGMSDKQSSFGIMIARQDKNRT